MPTSTGRERHHRGGIASWKPDQDTAAGRLRDKLQTTEGRAIYARRKAMKLTSRPGASGSSCCGVWTRWQGSPPCDPQSPSG